MGELCPLARHGVQHRSCALRDHLTVCFSGQHLSPNNMRGREPGLFCPRIEFWRGTTPSLPSRYKRRHWKTWFALTPYFNATRATEAPASSVSSTTRRRSAALRRRRGPAPNPPLRSTSTIHTSSPLKPTLYTRPTQDAYTEFTRCQGS